MDVFTHGFGQFTGACVRRCRSSQADIQRIGEARDPFTLPVRLKRPTRPNEDFQLSIYTMA